MKKTITFFPTQAAKMLLATLLLTLTAQTARAAEYEISTFDELREFMEAVHVEDFAGDVIRLTADIDCEKGRFNTGDPEYPSTFRGTFDGQGHKIYNFVHGPTGDGDYGYGTAMFDFAETGATIQNLTLEGKLPGDAYCGAYAAAFVLAVESPLGLLLDNCHFNGSVTNVYHSAALVGFASPGADYEGKPSIILNNCSANANITTTSNKIAGGLVAKGTGVEAYGCSFKGKVTSLGTVGGLIGEAINCKLEYCQVGSDVTLTGNKYVGGIAAGSDNGVITGCTSAATITGTINSGLKASYLGGIAGATGAGSTLKDNLFLGTIGGDLNEYIGAITGSDDGGNTFTNNAYTCEDYKGVGTASPNPSYDVDGIRKVDGVTLTKDGAGNLIAEFDGSSLTTLNIPTDVTVNAVNFSREFTSGTAVTVMLPFSLGEGQTFTGGTLYKFSGISKNETTGIWEATMTESATLHANTPYLMMPNSSLSSGKVTIGLNSAPVTLNTTTAGESSVTTDASDWEFKGSYEERHWYDGTDGVHAASHADEIGKVYGFAATSGKATDGVTDIAAGQFVRFASGAWICPTRCYLIYNGTGTPGAGARNKRAAAGGELPDKITVRLIGLNGTTTAIGTLDTKTGELRFGDSWFSLDGTKLSGEPAKKGVYIHKGKKVKK